MDPNSANLVAAVSASQKLLATAGSGASTPSAPASLVLAGRPGAPANTNGGLSVQVCGRLVNVPAESMGSLSLLSRHLASQLKLSGHSSLQFADVSGIRLNSDQDLAAALREGRHPLQASMTVAALREIEQKKTEVETKKEELAQFQWQVVVDQIASMSNQVATLTAQLQGVKDECRQSLQQASQEEVLRRERMEEAITKETQQREVGLKDIEMKVDKLVQAICAERSARDVAVHQLGSQLEQQAAQLESDRNLRTQDRAEVERLLQGMQHQVQAEQARNEEQWNWHSEAANRLEHRLEERAAADVAQQVKLNEVEANLERLRTSVSGVENALAAQSRHVQELLMRRGEELSKAVRDEMVGRENHIARFAKELETSWQSLEARLQRGREEASSATAAVAERARILEQRCAEVENDLSNHVRQQSELNQSLSDKMHVTTTSVDAMEMALKSSDVVTQTTVSRVDDIVERLVTVEEDLQQKVKADYWQPQMDALIRADQKFEAKLTALEKDMHSRLAQESAYRDGVKNQLQDTMKSCMDKIAGTKHRDGAGSSRFIEVGAANTSDDGGMVTPRCAFGSGTGPASAMVNSAGGSASALLPAGGAPPMLPLPGNGAATPTAPMQAVRAPLPGDKAQVVRQISLTGSMSPGHPGAQPRPVFVPRSMSPQASLQSVQSVQTVQNQPTQAMLRMFSPRA